jgi:FixJ family two-component response regulator
MRLVLTIGAKQYQSTMDGRLTVSHSSGMGCSENKGQGKRHFLSVVDDDESIRESLPDLLEEFGFTTRAFSSAEEFLSSGCVDETSCLILDIAMPGMGGPELHQELKRRGQQIPTVFITGQRDEGIRTRLLKQGAIEFLLKPINDEALVAAVKTALREPWNSANPA